MRDPNRGKFSTQRLESAYFLDAEAIRISITSANFGPTA